MGGGLNVIKTKNEFQGINLIKDTQKNYKIVLRKQKQISKKPEDERCFIKDKENIGLCPSCGEGVNSNYPYCGHCGQRVEAREGLVD